MKLIRWHDKRGMAPFSLIGLLAATAILIYLAVQAIPRQTGAGSATTPAAVSAPPGKAATPTQRAESVECRSNLNQVRQAITMHQTANEQFPATLAELSTQGVSGALLSCPVGGSSTTYRYDAASGRVSCPYPGHENY